QPTQERRRNLELCRGHGLGTTVESDLTGLDQLADPEGFHDIQQCTELAGRAGGFDDHGVLGDVDDPGAEDVRGVDDLRTVGAVRGDLDQHDGAGDGG